MASGIPSEIQLNAIFEKIATDKIASAPRLKGFAVQYHAADAEWKVLYRPTAINICIRFSLLEKVLGIEAKQ
ncbi:MAG: hypothetical protein KGH62_02070 [Candidatus Micrarchaeota archaeon]|nr:hypothetical protein [Candidatus Micrarchaeota archaeon]